MEWNGMVLYSKILEFTFKYKPKKLFYSGNKREL